MTGDGEIVTRVGRILTDDHRFAGYGALSELLGRETFLGAAFLGISGRRPNDDERDTLDALGLSMLAADPRIWPLRITRLVSSYGSTVAGFLAGQLIEEQHVIGPWASGPSAETLVALHEAAGDDPDDETFDGRVRHVLSERRRNPGFGVPFREMDERFVALRADIERRGRADLPYWRTIERVLASLVREKRHRANVAMPNIVLGCAAALLDMGLRPNQIQPMMVFLVSLSFLPNAYEGAQQRSAPLQELPPERVLYAGRAPRASGR